MKVELQKDFQPERQKLDSPVVIVLETPEEVNWAYTAFARVPREDRGPEDGRQDVFYMNTAGVLNDFAVSTGARRLAIWRRDKMMSRIYTYAILAVGSLALTALVADLLTQPITVPFVWMAEHLGR